MRFFSCLPALCSGKSVYSQIAPEDDASAGITGDVKVLSVSEHPPYARTGGSPTEPMVGDGYSSSGKIELNGEVIHDAVAPTSAPASTQTPAQAQVQEQQQVQTAVASSPPLVAESVVPDHPSLVVVNALMEIATCFVITDTKTSGDSKGSSYGSKQPRSESYCLDPSCSFTCTVDTNSMSRATVTRIEALRTRSALIDCLLWSSHQQQKPAGDRCESLSQKQQQQRQQQQRQQQVKTCLQALREILWLLENQPSNPVVSANAQAFVSASATTVANTNHPVKVNDSSTSVPSLPLLTLLTILEVVLSQIQQAHAMKQFEQLQEQLQEQQQQQQQEREHDRVLIQGLQRAAANVRRLCNPADVSWDTGIDTGACTKNSPHLDVVSVSDGDRTSVNSSAHTRADPPQVVRTITIRSVFARVVMRTLKLLLWSLNRLTILPVQRRIRTNLSGAGGNSNRNRNNNSNVNNSCGSSSSSRAAVSDQEHSLLLTYPLCLQTVGALISLYIGRRGVDATIVDRSCVSVSGSSKGSGVSVASNSGSNSGSDAVQGRMEVSSSPVLTRDVTPLLLLYWSVSGHCILLCHEVICSLQQQQVNTSNTAVSRSDTNKLVATYATACISLHSGLMYTVRSNVGACLAGFVPYVRCLETTTTAAATAAAMDMPIAAISGEDASDIGGASVVKERKTPITGATAATREFEQVLVPQCFLGLSQLSRLFRIDEGGALAGLSHAYISTAFQQQQQQYQQPSIGFSPSPVSLHDHVLTEMAVGATAVGVDVHSEDNLSLIADLASWLVQCLQYITEEGRKSISVTEAHTATVVANLIKIIKMATMIASIICRHLFTFRRQGSVITGGNVTISTTMTTGPTKFIGGNNTGLDRVSVDNTQQQQQHQHQHHRLLSDDVFIELTRHLTVFTECQVNARSILEQLAQQKLSSSYHLGINRDGGSSNSGATGNSGGGACSAVDSSSAGSGSGSGAGSSNGAGSASNGSGRFNPKKAKASPKIPSLSLNLSSTLSMSLNQDLSMGRHTAQSTPLHTGRNTGRASSRQDKEKVFLVGEAVELLCVMANGSERWFPATVVTVHHNPSGPLNATYDVMCKDTMETGRVRTEIREPKRRPGSTATTTKNTARGTGAGTPHSTSSGHRRSFASLAAATAANTAATTGASINSNPASAENTGNTDSLRVGSMLADSYSSGRTSANTVNGGGGSGGGGNSLGGPSYSNSNSTHYPYVTHMHSRTTSFNSNRIHDPMCTAANTAATAAATSGAEDDGSLNLDLVDDDQDQQDQDQDANEDSASVSVSLRLSASFTASIPPSVKPPTVGGSSSNGHANGHNVAGGGGSNNGNGSGSNGPLPLGGNNSNNSNNNNNSSGVNLHASLETAVGLNNLTRQSVQEGKNEDDDEDDDEDFVYAIPSVFGDSGNRDVLIANKVAATTKIPVMFFGNLNTSGSFTNMNGSSGSLSGGILRDAPTPVMSMNLGMNANVGVGMANSTTPQSVHSPHSVGGRPRQYSMASSTSGGDVGELCDNSYDMYDGLGAADYSSTAAASMRHDGCHEWLMMLPEVIQELQELFSFIACILLRGCICAPEESLDAAWLTRTLVPTPRSVQTVDAAPGDTADATSTGVAPLTTTIIAAATTSAGNNMAICASAGSLFGSSSSPFSQPLHILFHLRSYFETACGRASVAAVSRLTISGCSFVIDSTDVANKNINSNNNNSNDTGDGSDSDTDTAVAWAAPTMDNCMRLLKLITPCTHAETADAFISVGGGVGGGGGSLVPRQCQQGGSFVDRKPSDADTNKKNNSNNNTVGVPAPQPIFLPCVVMDHLGDSVAAKCIGNGAFGSVYKVSCSGACGANYNSRSGWLRYCKTCAYIHRTSKMTDDITKSNNDVNVNTSLEFAVKRIPREHTVHDGGVLLAVYNEISCMQQMNKYYAARGNIHTGGTCLLYDCGLLESEYLMVMECGRMNMREWRNNCFLTRDLNHTVATFGESTPHLNVLMNNNGMHVNGGDAGDGGSNSHGGIVGDDDLASNCMDIPQIWVLLLLLREAAIIVADLHAAGIVHFDLKCDNFILRQLPDLARLVSAYQHNTLSGMLFLTDFGEASPCPVVAKGKTGARCVGLALSGVSGGIATPATAPAAMLKCKGTLAIQSPEMLCLSEQQSIPVYVAPAAATFAKGSIPTDAAPAAPLTLMQQLRSQSPGSPSDVWSLGAMAVELLTGEYLFYASTWAELYCVLCMKLVAPSLAAVSSPLPSSGTSSSPLPPLTVLSASGLTQAIQSACDYASGAGSSSVGSDSAVAMLGVGEHSSAREVQQGVAKLVSSAPQYPQLDTVYKLLAGSNPVMLDSNGSTNASIRTAGAAVMSPCDTTHQSPPLSHPHLQDYLLSVSCVLDTLRSTLHQLPAERFESQSIAQLLHNYCGRCQIISAIACQESEFQTPSLTTTPEDISKTTAAKAEAAAKVAVVTAESYFYPEEKTQFATLESSSEAATATATATAVALHTGVLHLSDSFCVDIKAATASLEKEEGESALMPVSGNANAAGDPGNNVLTLDYSVPLSNCLQNQESLMQHIRQIAASEPLKSTTCGASADPKDDFTVESMLDISSMNNIIADVSRDCLYGQLRQQQQPLFRLRLERSDPLWLNDNLATHFVQCVSAGSAATSTSTANITDFMVVCDLVLPAVSTKVASRSAATTAVVPSQTQTLTQTQSQSQSQSQQSTPPLLQVQPSASAHFLPISTAALSSNANDGCNNSNVSNAIAQMNSSATMTPSFASPIVTPISSSMSSTHVGVASKESTDLVSASMPVLAYTALLSFLLKMRFQKQHIPFTSTTTTTTARDDDKDIGNNGNGSVVIKTLLSEIIKTAPRRDRDGVMVSESPLDAYASSIYTQRIGSVVYKRLPSSHIAAETADAVAAPLSTGGATTTIATVSDSAAVVLPVNYFATDVCARHFQQWLRYFVFKALHA